MIPWAQIADTIQTGASGTMQTAAPILQSLGKAATQQRKLIAADVTAMKAGQLGYSEAKKREMVQQAMDMARAQGLSGQQLAQVGAQAMQTANTDSEQQALIRKQQVLQRLKEQAARNAANWTQSTSHVGEMLGQKQGGGSSGGGMDIGSMASSLQGVLGK